MIYHVHIGDWCMWANNREWVAHIARTGNFDMRKKTVARCQKDVIVWDVMKRRAWQWRDGWQLVFHHSCPREVEE